MLRFLRENLWWWLTPILLVAVLLIALVAFSGDGQIVPFIYSFF